MILCRESRVQLAGKPMVGNIEINIWIGNPQYQDQTN